MSPERAVSVKREVLELKHLPPLSLTAVRLIELMADPEVEVDDIADIIVQDPGLAARIVGLANAAYFGQVQPIHSVKEAIVRVLGLNTVKSLSLSIAVSGIFKTDQCQNFSLRDYWFEAIGCATLARMLAKELAPESRPNPDAVYMGGLLHNLGYLILAYAFPVELSGVLDRMRREEEIDSISLQREQIGIDWISAGVWVARRWHLPESVVRMINGLDAEEHSSSDQLDAVLVAGSAHWMQHHIASRKADLCADPTLVSLPGLDVDTLNRIQSEWEEQVEELDALSRDLS
jgi:HD-like signal output (HDOD) protein